MKLFLTIKEMIVSRVMCVFFGVLVACHWSDCGGGICNKTSPVSYTCECKEGYYNLLKIGAFPCFQDCKYTNLLMYFSCCVENDWW